MLFIDDKTALEAGKRRESCYLVAVVNATPRLPAWVQIKEKPEGEKPRLIYFAGNARCCVRQAHGAEIHYELVEINDLRQPLLVSTRAIAVSPFPEDKG